MYGQRDDVRWYLGVSEDVSIHTTKTCSWFHGGSYDQIVDLGVPHFYTKPGKLVWTWISRIDLW